MPLTMMKLLCATQASEEYVHLYAPSWLAQVEQTSVAMPYTHDLPCRVHL